jgi:hypothetical protein
MPRIANAAAKNAMSVEPRWRDVADIVAVPYIPANKNPIISTNLVRFLWIELMLSTLPMTPVTRQNAKQTRLTMAAMPGAIHESHHSVATVAHAVVTVDLFSLPSDFK